MVITTKPQWEFHSVYRGLRIWRRKAHTGTSQGQWLCSATYFGSLKAVRAWVDSVPENTLATYVKSEQATSNPSGKP